VKHQKQPKNRNEKLDEMKRKVVRCRGAVVIAFPHHFEEEMLPGAGADFVLNNGTDVSTAHNARGLPLILSGTRAGD
jgi:hypothetical protein